MAKIQIEYTANVENLKTKLNELVKINETLSRSVFATKMALEDMSKATSQSTTKKALEDIKKASDGVSKSAETASNSLKKAASTPPPKSNYKNWAKETESIIKQLFSNVLEYEKNADARRQKFANDDVNRRRKIAKEVEKYDQETKKLWLAHLAEMDRAAAESQKRRLKLGEERVKAKQREVEAKKKADAEYVRWWEKELSRLEKEEAKKAQQSVRVTEKASREKASSEARSSKQREAEQKRLTREAEKEERKRAAAAEKAEKEKARATQKAEAERVAAVQKSNQLLTAPLREIRNMVAGAFAIGAIKSFTQEIVVLLAELEILQSRINFIYGSETGGSAGFLRLSTAIKDLGLDFKTTIEQFTTFNIAAQQANFTTVESEKMFIDFAASLRAVGASNLQVQRAFYALQQMMSKGVVAAEELRRQMGEALPGAGALMFKAFKNLHPEMVQTERDFMKLQEQGKILSREVLPEFVRVVKEEFSPALEAKKNSLTASIERAEMAWMQFKAALLDTGPIKSALQFVTAQLERANRAFALYDSEREASVQREKEELGRRRVGEGTETSFSLDFLTKPLLDKESMDALQFFAKKGGEAATIYESIALSLAKISSLIKGLPMGNRLAGGNVFAMQTRNVGAITQPENLLRTAQERNEFNIELELRRRSRVSQLRPGEEIITTEQQRKKFREEHANDYKTIYKELAKGNTELLAWLHNTEAINDATKFQTRLTSDLGKFEKLNNEQRAAEMAKVASQINGMRFGTFQGKTFERNLPTEEKKELDYLISLSKDYALKDAAIRQQLEGKKEEMTKAEADKRKKHLQGLVDLIKVAIEKEKFELEKAGKDKLGIEQTNSKQLLKLQKDLADAELNLSNFVDRETNEKILANKKEYNLKLEKLDFDYTEYVKNKAKERTKAEIDESIASLDKQLITTKEYEKKFLDLTIEKLNDEKELNKLSYENKEINAEEYAKRLAQIDKKELDAKKSHYVALAQIDIAYIEKKISLVRQEFVDSEVISRRELSLNEQLMNAQMELDIRQNELHGELAESRREKTVSEIKKMYSDARKEDNQYFQDLQDYIDEPFIGKVGMERRDIRRTTQEQLQRFNQQVDANRLSPEYYTPEVQGVDPVTGEPQIGRVLNMTAVEKTRQDIIASGKKREQDLGLGNILGLSDKDLENLKKTVDAAIDIFSDYYAARTEIAKNAIEKEQALLDKKFEAGLIRENEYNEETKKNKEEMAKLDRDAARFGVLINTAQAIVKLYTDFDAITATILAAGVVAVGATQLSAINSAPLPEFHEGGLDIKKNDNKKADRGLKSGEFYAKLLEGESVMTREETAKYKDVLKAIREDSLPSHIMKGYTAPAYHRSMDEPYRMAKEQTSLELAFQNAELVDAIRRNGAVAIKNPDEIADAIVSKSSYTKITNRRRIR